jgi:hypothetical protein
MPAILMFLSMIPIIVTAVRLLVKYTVPILSWFRGLIRFGAGTVLYSGFAGILISLISFLGGFFVIVLLGYHMSIERLAFLMDILITPFSMIIKVLLDSVIYSAGGCPQMPSAFNVFLGVLHLHVFMSVVVISICCEVFLRLFIAMVLRINR